MTKSAYQSNAVVQERIQSLLDDGYFVVFIADMMDKKVTKLRHRRNRNVINLTYYPKNSLLTQTTNGVEVFRAFV